MRTLRNVFYITVFICNLFNFHSLYAMPKGDVDSNGIIDAVDALLTAQYTVDINVPIFDVNAADVYQCDGNIDILDALLIAQYTVGLVTQFPCPDLPWEKPLSASSLPGLQVNANADSTRLWIFANMLHGAEAGIIGNSVTPEQANTYANSIQVDEYGWPVSLPAGCSMWISCGYMTGETPDPESNDHFETYLKGVYVLTWKGSGNIQLETTSQNGQGYRYLLQNSNRIVLRIDDPQKHPLVRVYSTDPANHITDVKLWPPRYDGAGQDLTEASDLAPGHIAASLEPLPGTAEPFWHPQFLSHHRELKGDVYRFMDWLRICGIEESEPVEWNDRALATYAFRNLNICDASWTRFPVKAYKQRLGLPYEWIIDLCNELGVDLWIQVPHLATDDMIRQLCSFIAGSNGYPGLRHDLRVWFEFSNEIWNPVSAYLPQANLACQIAAQHFNKPVDQIPYLGSEHAWGSGYLQGHALQVFENEWHKSGMTDDRLINVVAGFVAMPEFNQTILNAVREINTNLPEVLAVTSYFGAGTQGEIYNLYNFGTRSPELQSVWPVDLYERTKAVIRRDLYSTIGSWKANAELAETVGIPLVGYEGGQHVLAMGYGDWDNPSHVDFMRFLEHFEDSPAMGTLYSEHYALWSAMGAQTVSLFVDVSAYSFWGYWGAKRIVNQTCEQAPKWNAAVRWSELQKGVRSFLEPLGTRPLLPELKINQEAGIDFHQTIQSTGGEGTVILSIIGGELPPGITFNYNGSGTATLSGTPTQSGLYRIIIRAKDRDADIDDHLYQLSIDPAGTSTNSIIVFKGSEIPLSIHAPDAPWENGRYDPRRSYKIEGNNERKYLPFSIADGDFIFADEYSGGTGYISPQGQLNLYGGWSIRCLPYPADTPPENIQPYDPTSYTGLRYTNDLGGFWGWNGDSYASTEFDACLIWRRDQFTGYTAGRIYSFGQEAVNSTLRLDINSLNTGNKNEIRFVILNHENSGQDIWYISEAVYQKDTVGDGYFELTQFCSSNETGKRWGVFTPTASDFCIPDMNLLTFTAGKFNDVRAVGIIYHTEKQRYHYEFGFTRFIAQAN